MVTTIQLQEDTLELLKAFKEQKEAASYDEAIRAMLTENSKRSMSGFLRKEMKMKDILKGLRDKYDRI